MLRSADQAVLRGDAGPLPGAGRGGRARDRHDGRGRRSRGGATTMHQNRDPRGALGGERRGLRHRRPGPRPELRQHRHGQRQLGLPDDPPGARRSPTRARPATRSSSATPPRRRAPTRRRSSRRRSSPRRRTSCSPTRRSSTAAWRSSAGESLRPSAGMGYDRSRRAPLDAGCEPAAPPARRRPIRRPVSPIRPSPEDSRGRAPPRPRPPRRRATSPPPTAGTREFEAFSDFDLPTYVGPDDVHEPALGHRSRRAPRSGRGRGDHRRAVRRRGQPPARRALRAAGDPRGPVHVGLDQLPPARRRAVRGPDRRRCRRREHRPGLDRARPRDDLPQGPRGRRDRRDPDRPRRRPLDHLAVGDRVAEVRRPGQHRDRPLRRPRRHRPRRLGRARRPRHADAAAHRVRARSPARTSSRSACAATGRRSRSSSG